MLQPEMRQCDAIPAENVRVTVSLSVAPVTGDESGYYGELTMVNSAHKCGDRAPITILLDINLYWLVVYNQHEYSVHRTDMNLSCL